MFASSPVTLGMAIMSWRNLIDFSRLSSTFRRSFSWTFALILDPPKITSAARRFHCSPCASRRRAGARISCDHLWAVPSTCDRSSRRCRQRCVSRFCSRSRGASSPRIGEQIDVQLDDLAAIDDVGHINRYACSVDHDAEAFGRWGTQCDLEQVGGLHAGAGDHDGLEGMPNFDVEQARENCQGGARQESIRIAIEHRAGKMKIYDAVRFAVLVLQAPDETIFV